MFYFSSDDIEIAGASPETLVKLTDGKLFWPGASKKPHERIPSIEAFFQGRIPADEIIAATSVVEGIPLLTRDGKILKSKIVPLAT